MLRTSVPSLWVGHSFLFHRGHHDFPLAVELLCIWWCLSPDSAAKCILSVRLTSRVSQSLKAHCLGQLWEVGHWQTLPCTCHLVPVLVTCHRAPG